MWNIFRYSLLLETLVETEKLQEPSMNKTLQKHVNICTLYTTVQTSALSLLY